MDLEAFHLQTEQFRWSGHYNALEECIQHCLSSTDHGYKPLSLLRALEAKLDRSLLTGSREIALAALKDAEALEGEVAPSNVVMGAAKGLSRWWSGSEVPMTAHLKGAAHAHCLTIKGIIQLQTGSKVKGLYSLGRAYSAFHKLPAPEALPDSESFESQVVINSKLFGVGAFMVFMSYLPPRLIGFLELVGFKFDRGEGMLMLQQCSANAGCVYGVGEPSVSE